MAARLCQLQMFGLMLPSPAVESIQVDSCIEMSRGSYLGLKSRKSPSLLNLIQMNLSGEISDLEKTVQVSDDDATLLSSEKKKATNFPATLLKIGKWKIEAKCEGEIVAKIYFAKRKLVWEMLKRPLKYKIEILWSDIVAIEATEGNNGPDILNIELSQPPLFFSETNPQPRQHTLWQSSNDFTDHEASTHRRHHLEFPKGTLGKHYKNLMQCDKRLKELSQRGYPSLPTPFFPKKFEGPNYYRVYRPNCAPLYNQQSGNWCASQLQGSSHAMAIDPISSDEVDQPFIDGNNLDESYRGFGDPGFENWSLNPTVDLQQPCQEVLPLNVCSTHALELYSSRPFVGEFAAGTESDGGHNSIELLDKDRGLQMLDCMMVEANDVSLRDYEPSLLARVQSMEYLLDKPKYSVSSTRKRDLRVLVAENKDISNQVESENRKTVKRDRTQD